jgi:hypothetical protein
VQAHATASVGEAFDASRALFDTLVGWLADDASAAVSHAHLEERVHTEGMEVLRQMYQDHLDLRAAREERLGEVVDADGHGRGTVETDHGRALLTRFGKVTVARLAYRARRRANLHPADAVLNLPVEAHSHGLRKLAVVEGVRGSFTDAAVAIGRATGVRIGKRQVEELLARAAADIDRFYAAHEVEPGSDDDVLVMTFDGKGVVVRPDALREDTAKNAASRKLAGRLSRGEKRCRKRMAEVAAVYDLPPAPRTVGDILPEGEGERAAARPTPRAHGKWLTASVTDDAATVIAAGFHEATRRDPDHRRDWVALVDGNTHQIERIRAESRARRVDVTILVDLIHVIEYLWKAAWCFFAEGDAAAEKWVRDQTRQILAGRASVVAGAIRRKATYHGLDPGARKAADTTATYLLNKKRHLDYPTALANGWPIATGVIEGACRHLVKDRMDITGARWGLNGAEAVLKLRALISSGDFDQYWDWHLEQERLRVHNANYLGEIIPTQ